MLIERPHAHVSTISHVFKICLPLEGSSWIKQIVMAIF